MDFFKNNEGLQNASYYMQKKNNSMNPLQWIWDFRIGRENIIASPVFPVIISVTTYFVCCISYMCLDFVGKKIPILHKYKIQNDKEVTWPMVLRAVKHTILNNILLILPASIAQCIWVPLTPLPLNAPDLSEFVWQMFMMLVLFDFQYWIWHTIHHKNKWLYRNFHAIHHQYHSTFSWTTQYLHPWELFTVGFFTTVDGWFFNCHPLTYWGFMLLNVIVSVEAHSGFDLPISLSKIIPFRLYGGSGKHDMHHMRPLTNFQPFFSTWDRIMGWDCPGLEPGGIKSKRLLAWEANNKNKRQGKHATQLMKGTVNGLLFPKEDICGDDNLKYD